MTDMPAGAEAPDDKPERKSAATMLVEIAEERYEFGVSDAGEAYAIPRVGPKVVQLLRGGKTSLRGQLARTYFARYHKAAPQQALADALLVIEGTAQESDREHVLHLRVAEHGASLWLDLADQTGRAVRIDATGWAVEDRAPVLFKRTALNGPLPTPVPGGSLDELWHWLNVTKEDRPLVAAYLVAALRPALPHPVLNLSGEQGSGKTTAQKVLVTVLDPGPVPNRKPPRDADSWVTAAAGSWVVGLDNLSDIPDWLSDSICRAGTGEGDVRRKLYTDGEFAVFAFRRCIVITGIDLGAVNGDLADRMLPIHLDVISGSARLEENELWPGWGEAHPRILGAVLDLAASVAAVFPSVRLETKPRMADFARVLACVDRVLGTNGLDRYCDKQGALASESLTGDVFVVAIAEAFTDRFVGTSVELVAAITPTDEKWKPPRDWPKTARAATARLRRQAPVMRKAGWTVEEDGGANHRNAVLWLIIPPARPEMVRNPDSHGSHSSPSEVGRESASHASNEYGPSQDDEPEAGNLLPRRLVIEGGRVPDGAVYIGRAMPRYGLASSPFANPHRIGKGVRNGKPCPVPECAGAMHDRDESLRLYQDLLPGLAGRARVELPGRDLACWCPADLPCHGDLLLAIANGEEP